LERERRTKRPPAREDARARPARERPPSAGGRARRADRNESREGERRVGLLRRLVTFLVLLGILGVGIFLTHFRFKYGEWFTFGDPGHRETAMDEAGHLRDEIAREMHERLPKLEAWLKDRVDELPSPREMIDEARSLLASADEAEPQSIPGPAGPATGTEPGPAPETRTEPVPAPAPRPEPKPEPRPAPRPEPKPVPAPAPRPVSRPEPRPAPPPVDDLARARAAFREGLQHYKNTEPGSPQEKRELRAARKCFRRCADLLEKVQKQRPNDAEVEKLHVNANRFLYACMKRTTL